MITLKKRHCLTELKNIPEKSIFVSDPPFNIGYKYNTYKDKMKEDEYYQFLSKALGGAKCLA